MGLTNKEIWLRNLEKKLGMSREEIRKLSPWETHNKFYKKTSFDKLNPLKRKDARKIIDAYENHKPPYDNEYYCKGVIFRKMIDAQLTIQGI